MSRSIGQALADDTLERANGAPLVVDAQRAPGIIPEIELGKVAVKVLFLAVLVNAHHSALENTERALNGVGVNVASDVFAVRMADAFMPGNVPIGTGIEAAFVGMQNGLAGHVLDHKRGDGLFVGTVNMEGTDRAATFDKSDDGHFVGYTPALLAVRATLPGRGGPSVTSRSGSF